MDWTKLNISDQRGRLFDAIHSLPNDERKEQLRDYVEQQIAFILKEDGLDSSKLGRSFMAIGFDSLMAVELLYCIQRDLDRPIDPTALEQETIDQFVDFVNQAVWPS